MVGRPQLDRNVNGVGTPRAASPVGRREVTSRVDYSLDELLGMDMHLPSSYSQQAREHEAMKEATALEYVMRKEDTDKALDELRARLPLRSKSYGARHRPYAYEER